MMKVTQAQFDEMARVGTVSHLEVVDDVEARVEAKLAADEQLAADTVATDEAPMTTGALEAHMESMVVDTQADVAQAE